MKRRIIHIDESACNGCGLCAKACHEGAIGMVGGKARLMRDDYCDGLGDCLPACPAGAITFEEREAPAYNAEAVKRAQAHKASHHPAGCPGSQARTITSNSQSQLRQWPVQIKLVPLQAPYFQGADLLIAADCTAYAYAAFHQDFLRGRVALVGCPKLDGVDYAEKLAEIFSGNEIRSVTVVRMEVPCCGGLQNAAQRALDLCGKAIPCRVVTLSTDGRILS